MKKIKDMDPNQVAYSENALLAERSFESGQHTPTVANGYHLEWRANMAKNTSLPEEGHTNVGICNHGKALSCLHHCQYSILFLSCVSLSSL